MSRGRTAVAIGLLVVLTSCSSGVEVVEEEDTLPKGPCGTSPAADVAQEDTGASENVTQPKPGDYVYDFCGLGDTPVPAGTRLTEKLSLAGNVYTIDVRNNLNSNTRRYQIRWEPKRVTQISNETLIGGQRRSCNYEPPLEILHLPLRIESFPMQETTAPLCAGTIEINVLGRQTVKDSGGKAWPTWVIEINSQSGARTDQERHWFAPELGRDIRLETRTDESGATNQTAQLLRRRPPGSG